MARDEQRAVRQEERCAINERVLHAKRVRLRVAAPFLLCRALQSDATKATASLCDAVQVWGRVTRSGFPAFSFSFSALSALSAIQGRAACILKCGVSIAIGSDALLAYGLRLVDRLESDWQECLPESEHDMSEAGMLREMKADEGSKGCSPWPQRGRQRRTDCPRDAEAGSFGASSTRLLNADGE